jgi:hypothetical protein
MQWFRFRWNEGEHQKAKGEVEKGTAAVNSRSSALHLPNFEIRRLKCGRFGCRGSARGVGVGLANQRPISLYLKRALHASKSVAARASSAPESMIWS